ncbi:hypothetical protein LJC60_10360 [Ruminococcaceae bacterium OttesenSCG-928-D13]|nr:hypothetical protein [Ruminococcaceae bacterium OttesenSCG-928-D13]
MGRRSGVTPLLPWQSALPVGDRQAGKDHYVRIGHSVLMHPSVAALPPSAFRVFIYALAAAGPKMEFKLFPGQVPGMTRQTFYDSVKVLETRGFITVERWATPGRSNRYKFVCDWDAMKAMVPP